MAPPAAPRNPDGSSTMAAAIAPESRDAAAGSPFLGWFPVRLLDAGSEARARDAHEAEKLRRRLREVEELLGERAAEPDARARELARRERTARAELAALRRQEVEQPHP